jgi:hypothetical protein
MILIFRAGTNSFKGVGKTQARGPMQRSPPSGVPAFATEKGCQYLVPTRFRHGAETKGVTGGAKDEEHDQGYRDETSPTWKV